MRGATAVPPGYVHRRDGRAEVVALATAADSVTQALAAGGTLYGYAAGRPEARALHGRAPVYAVALPDDGPRVVVRHSRHGGLLGPLTGDRFVYPTRAPVELATAVRLARAGVHTPEIVAYALYPAGPLFCRADVATREIAAARDLGEVLADAEAARDTESWLPPLATLLRALARAGAHHPDLNVKNVLLAGGAPGETTAYVIDVDRVRFGAPNSPAVAAANVARLVRSARKRRAQRLAHVSDEALTAIAGALGQRPGAGGRPVHRAANR